MQQKAPQLRQRSLRVSSGDRDLDDARSRLRRDGRGVDCGSAAWRRTSVIIRGPETLSLRRIRRSTSRSMYIGHAAKWSKQYSNACSRSSR